MAKKRRMKPEIELTTEEVKQILEPEKHNMFGKVMEVDLLNIRVKPNGEIKTQVRKNEILKILDGTPVIEGVEKWYNVVTQAGIEGWAMSKFLFLYEENKFEEV